jgi:nitrate reductase gamma subunit
MLAILWRRLTHPVMKLLSTTGDYLAWTLTFLPLLTGYMTFHHLWFNYTGLLATHILTAELLLVFFPFTKLTHTFTLFIARWYNGVISGERGVQA